MGSGPELMQWYFVVATLLTVPASWAVVIAYRRNVRRGMHGTAEDEGPSGQAPAPPGGKPPRAGERPAPPASTALLRWRVVVAYVLGTAAAAAVLTAFMFASTPDLEVTPFRAFIFFYAFVWPLPPALGVLLVERHLATVRLALAYVLLGAVAVLGWSLVARFALGHAHARAVQNLRGFALILAVSAVMPIVLVLISGSRRLRLVVPMLLVGLLTFGLGTLPLRYAIARAVDFTSFRWMIAHLGYTPMLLLASLPVGLLCWSAQRWLGARYESKRFSDLQLLVDAWVAIAVIAAAADLAARLGWSALWALTAFVAYRVVVAAALALRPVSSAQPPPARLLLLRVFGTPRRAERLFDVVTGDWRFRGNVNLIAGTDLAARTIDPGEILAFLGGDLRAQFVRDRPDLERRLAALDERRDPDGRFRVNDFFCFDDTWRPTLVALLERVDVVLMDLRGVSRSNAGCLFEIQKLAERGKLERALFVVDDDAEEQLLRATVGQALQGMGRRDQPALDIARVRGASRAELAGVLAALRARLPAA